MKTEEIIERFNKKFPKAWKRVKPYKDFPGEGYLVDQVQDMLSFIKSEIEAAEERTGRKLKRENEKLKRDLFKSNERWRKGKYELQRQVEAIVKINKQTEAKIEAAERRRTEGVIECLMTVFRRRDEENDGDWGRGVTDGYRLACETLKSKFLKNPEQ